MSARRQRVIALVIGSLAALIAVWTITMLFLPNGW